MLSRAVDAYPAFDVGNTALWLHLNLANPAVGMFLNDHAVAIVSWQMPFFWPERMAKLNFFYSDRRHPWAAVRCFKAALDWARSEQCKELTFDAITGVDLSPFARRFGAKRESVYRMRL